jgi:hypothetical protein
LSARQAKSKSKGEAQGEEGLGLAFARSVCPLVGGFLLFPSFYSPFSCWFSPGHWQGEGLRKQGRESARGRSKSKGLALLFALALVFFWYLFF